MQPRTPLMLLSILLVSSARAGEPTREQLAFFESRIRPILAEHCYRCHSTKSRRPRAGLRLDSRAGLLKGGDSGPAVVPNHPEKSLLIEAINYRKFEMPPRGKLAKKDIDALTEWVRQGAFWPKEAEPTVDVANEFDWKKRKEEHWSWQPIANVSPPIVKRQNWVRHPIDRFILARLEEKQLTPAPEADRRTLIRRLYFDLVGLPPTPDEVEAFVRDESPKAYERLVDSLLASEHFGEKWGRHWLDLVRYAETYGHEFDYPIANAWRYRDYIIRAFNSDVPYNQLVLEHIAGDLLPDPRRNPDEGFNESIIGTGFWFFGEATHAPTDVKGDEADRIDNQIDVFSKTFLALTVSCARCHDHKFDPISTQDYYALAGFLQSSRRQDAMLDPGGRIRRAADTLRSLRIEGSRRLQQAFNQSKTEDVSRYLLAACAVSSAARKDDTVADVAQRHRVDKSKLKRWLSVLAEPEVRSPEHPLYAWYRLTNARDSFAQARQKLREEVQAFDDDQNKDDVLLEDFADAQGWFATGEAFASLPTTGNEWDALSAKPKFVPAGLAHSGLLSRRLHGVLRSPTFVLSHRYVDIRMKATGTSVRLIIDGYQMEPFNSLLFNGTRLDVRTADTQGRFVWKRLGNPLYVGHKAYLEFIDHGDGFFAIDEIRLSDGPRGTESAGSITKAIAGNENIETIEQLAAEYARLAERDVGFKKWLLAKSLVTVGIDMSDLEQKTIEVEKTIPAPMLAVAITDGTGENEHVFIRGSHKNLGQLVERRFLVALAGEDQEKITDGSGRLELARRVLDPANPFPARVLVNRLWHHLFGRGIVPTVDDFGKMGQPPSHPELLDWLASDFVRGGWSVKRAIRQMVLSSTYRMSSDPNSVDAREKEIDPDNTLLYRMPIRRLPAESIRDAILAVSGRLDRKLYGPSVNVHLTPFMQGRGRPRSGPLDGAGRRSIYLAIRRNFLSPMMLTFDFPVPFSTMGRRTVSNVPAQALILMNDPFVIAEAKRWAERSLQEADPERRLRMMFVAAFAREPTSRQLEHIRQFVDSQARLYRCNTDDVRIWSDVAHMMFNMKDFIFLR
ncbi:MAG: hypothetical protein KatS3mg105_1142 [Gemmatales bacterium]|nr:MAG: hypothetical protein KatS3mg105_1142 [Gemmatales bacterium]